MRHHHRLHPGLDDRHDQPRRGDRLLLETGIAPPESTSSRPSCPRCGSPAPRVVSEFGSTACKALMVCSSCREPFDLFKEHR